MPVALVTGGSAGLGLALARTLSDRGWSIVIDGRRESLLRDAVPGAVAVRGDVADPAHRRELADAVADLGRLDLLVNNASTIGASPMPALADLSYETLLDIYRVNVFAPLALTQLVLPLLAASDGTIVNVTSDAAVEPYEGWGGYGSSKAALDQLSAVLGAELAGWKPTAAVRVYGFDPGDLRTALHQAAFPGEDISDRSEPESVIPALLRLIDERPPSGRFRASVLAGATGARR